MTVTISAATDNSVDGTTLALLRIPFIFSQDNLLKSDEFIRQAASHGYALDLVDLQKMYEYKILSPLYIASDEPFFAPEITFKNLNYQQSAPWLFEFASKGCLNDATQKNYCEDFPFFQPPGEKPHNWWNGYIYSDWQLTRLPTALMSLKNMEAARRDGNSITFENHFNSDYLAMAALSSKYLPWILGRWKLTDESEDTNFLEFTRETNAEELLKIAAFNPQNLLPRAEALLAMAHMKDPMINWWPLIRHSNISGWEKLKGPALNSVWCRIASEIFLRAHEEMSKQGKLDPLPNLEGVPYWSALHDRIFPHWKNERPLEIELASYGLSPHPRVLILAEGETEEIHFGALLEELGLNRPDRVRIQIAKSSRVDPKLLAKFAIAPKAAHTLGQFKFMLPPTMLVVAMDPENKTKSPADESKFLSSIRNAVREEVGRQGRYLSDSALSQFVNLFVWPDGTYEFSNFSDDELFDGLKLLTTQKNPDKVQNPEWEISVRQGIAQARKSKSKLVDYLGRLGVPDNKPLLAKILLPNLIERFKFESTQPEYITPVFRLIDLAHILFMKHAQGLYTFEVADHMINPALESNP